MQNWENVLWKEIGEDSKGKLVKSFIVAFREISIGTDTF